MSRPADEFAITVRGLEGGLQVQHIATMSPRTINAGEAIEGVLQDPDLLDFDYIPVIQDNFIVEVIERYDESGTKLDQPQRAPLTSAMLVSGSLPLAAFVPLMRQRRYWLVVQETGATGIVTRSDVLKLPIRLYAFSLVIHLETVMASLIRLLYPDGHQRWLAGLSEKRRAAIESEHKELKARRENLTWLELTYFTDKTLILIDEKSVANREIHSNLSPEWTAPEGLRETLWTIKDWRNDVAHPKNYAANDNTITGFLQTLEDAEKWIAVLQRDIDCLAGTGGQTG